MAIVWIDIESPAGAKQGSGPITSASFWRYTARMDKAGIFEFEMPASDPKATLIRKKYIVRAYTVLDGTRTEVGAGIIDKITKKPQADGTVSLRVSGDDLVRELTYRSVKNLKLYLGGNPVSHATAVAAIEAYAPAGWAFTADGSPLNDSVYGYFNGETVLAGAIKIAQKSYNHFYRGSGRSLVFASSFTPSGVRAIQAKGELSASTCAIQSLTEEINTYSEINRIYPRGSGNASVQLTLRATTRTAPAGYTLNAAENYIEYDAAVASDGLIERQVDFRDIGPIDNTDADIVSASNALFDAALEELRRRSSEIEEAVYTVQLEGCSQLLRPLQSVKLVYRNSLAGLDINTDLNILEATWQVDSSGVHTTALQVSNSDRWPKSDVGTIVDGIEQGHVYQALPQLNANSYVTAYNKNVDVDNTAAFRFRFGDEVTQLQQVLFEFQLLPFESTVKSIAGETITSSEGGGSVQSAASGGSHTHSVTIPAHSHTVTIAAHSHTVTVAAHTHSVTIPGHNHSVTVAAHTHSVTVAAHTHSVSISAHTHTIPNHQHQITVAGGSGGVDLTLSVVGGLGFLTKAAAGDVKINTNSDTGSTTSSNGGSSTPTSSSGGGQTVTSSSGGGQTVTSNTLSDSVATSSSGGGQSVSSTTQSQTTPSSSVATQSVETSSTNGNHTHAVTIPNHTHTLLPVLSAVYGIFRDTEAHTYEVGDLQYRVNGGAWLDLDTATDAGSGWYALDITGDVYDSTTYRPLQASNLLEIRAKLTGSLNISTWNLSSGYLTITTSTAHGIEQGDIIEIIGQSLTGLGVNLNGEYTVYSVGDTQTFVVEKAGALESGSGDGTVRRHKTATIDAQLSVRNTIQAIAYV